MKNDDAHKGGLSPSFRRGMPLRSVTSPKKVSSMPMVRFSMNHRLFRLPRETKAILKQADQEGQYVGTGEKKSIFERLNLPAPKNLPKESVGGGTYQKVEEQQHHQQQPPAPVVPTAHDVVHSSNVTEEGDNQWMFDHTHNNLALLEIESVYSAEKGANVDKILSDLGEMEKKNTPELSETKQTSIPVSEGTTLGTNQGENPVLKGENIVWVESSFADTDLSMDELSQAWATHSRKGSDKQPSTVAEPSQVSQESGQSAKYQKSSFHPSCWLGGLCASEEVVDDKVKENTPVQQQQPLHPSPESIRAMLAEAENYGSRLLEATRNMDLLGKTQVNNSDPDDVNAEKKPEEKDQSASEVLGIDQLLTRVPANLSRFQKRESYMTDLSSVLGTRWIDDESSAPEQYEDNCDLPAVEPDTSVEVGLVGPESVSNDTNQKEDCPARESICLSLNPEEWKTVEAPKLNTSICTVVEFPSSPTQYPELNRSCSTTEDPTRGLQEFISQTWHDLTKASEELGEIHMNEEAEEQPLIHTVAKTNQELEEDARNDIRRVGLELEEEPQTRSDITVPDSEEAENERTRDPAEHASDSLVAERSDVSLPSAAPHGSEPVVSEDESSEYEKQAKLQWQEAVMLNQIAYSLVSEASSAANNY